MEQNEKVYQIWKVIFFTGIILGAFLTNLFFKNQAGISDLWNLDQYRTIAAGELPQKQYFIFLLFRRGKQLLGILLLFFFTNRFIGIGVPLFLFSFSTSALFALETMRIGIVGVLVSIVYLIPHYFVYGGALYGLFQIGEKQKKDYQMLLQLICIIGIWGLGCYIEAYWNPTLVRKITMLLIGK